MLDRVQPLPPSPAGSEQRRLPGDDTISRAELVAFGRRHVLTIVGCAFLGLLLAGLYAASEVPSYTARTQVLIGLKAPVLNAQEREVETSLDTAEMESQMTLLRSELIANMVIDELGLMDDPEFRDEKISRREMLGRTLSDLATRLGLRQDDGDGAEPPEAMVLAPPAPEEPAGADAAAEPPQPDVAATEPAGGEAGEDAVDRKVIDRRRLALEIFQSRLSVSRISVSYVIEIGFNARDPERAAEIANVTAAAYLREQLLSKVAAMQQGNEWLEARLNELRGKLSTATQAAQAFRALHDYGIPEQDAPDPAVAEERAVQGGGDPEKPTLEVLEATADTYRKLYGSVLEAFTSSMQNQSYPYSPARVITPASPPFSKSHPRTKITLMFGGLAGLLLGIAIALGRQSVDVTLRSARQVRSELGVDCLTVLPRIRPTARDHRGIAHVAVHPNSTFAKALTRLKTAARLHVHAKNPLSIGVTSALRGEGRSTVAGNLGLAFAAGGNRTLVIDGDPARASSLGRLLVPATGKGAAGSGTPLVQPVPLPGAPAPGRPWFDFLSADNLPHDDWRSGNLWSEILDGHDIVVVDLPPIEEAIDVLPQLPALDATIVLVEWGSTPVDAVAEAIQVAAALGLPVLGAVLTQAPAGGIPSVRDMLPTLDGAASSKAGARLHLLRRFRRPPGGRRWWQAGDSSAEQDPSRPTRSTAETAR